MIVFRIQNRASLSRFHLCVFWTSNLLPYGEESDDAHHLTRVNKRTEEPRRSGWEGPSMGLLSKNCRGSSTWVTYSRNIRMIQLMDKPSRKQVGMVHSNTGELGGYTSYSPAGQILSISSRRFEPSWDTSWKQDWIVGWTARNWVLKLIYFTMVRGYILYDMYIYIYIWRFFESLVPDFGEKSEFLAWRL